jgi:glycosyltransferase involved in cell wall biosynthesis
VLEAMACRTPIVASSISGVVDHVVHGSTGYLVPPNSSSSLEDGIVSALSDPRRDEVARSGEAHVSSDLTWPNVMRLVIERVYRPLMPAVAR